MPRKFAAIDFKSALTAEDEPRPDLTLRDLVLSHELVRPDLALLSRLRKWTDQIGDENAWSITTAALSRCAEAMAEAGYAPGSVNRDIGSLGMVYIWATTIAKIAPRGFRSPTKDVPRLPDTLRRVEITEDEIKAIRLLSRTLFLKDKRFTLFIHILLDSGARCGEIYERTWSQLDTERGQITVPTTKNGDPRTLFISPATADMAESLRGRPDALIFGSTRTRGLSPVNYRKSWAKLAQAIKRPDLRLHDLRHHVARDLLRRGHNVAQVAQVLGHRDHTMTTRRYGFLAVTDLAEVQRSRFEQAQP